MAKRTISKSIEQSRASKKAKTTKRSSYVTKQYLYRALNRRMETKVATHTVPSQLIHGAINSGSQFFPLMPSVANGIHENNRIGNYVKPVKLVIEGTITYNANVEQTGSITQARMLLGAMYCVQPREYRSHADGIPSINILERNGSPDSFKGYPSDCDLPLNTAEFLHYRKIIWPIIKPYGHTHDTAPGSGYFGGSTGLIKRFKIILTKELPARLHFTENENNPTNCAPYLAVGYADAENAAPDTVTTQLRLSYTSTLYYKDA